MKHLLKLLDLTGEEIIELLNLADQLGYEQRHGIAHPKLAGKTLGILLEKPSTRTRVAFEVGMVQLGGYPLALSAAELQLGRGEPVRDTARSLSGYLDAVAVRTRSQKTLEEFAENGSIPVINALTDFAHPCQALAVLMTIREQRGSFAGLKLAFVGDGRSNVAHSTIVGCLKMGMTVAVAAPKGHEPDPAILAFAKEYGDRFLLTQDPAEAVSGADVVSTDVWASMGQEAEEAERQKRLAPYQVNRALLAHAKPDATVQHCLPARRGEEITDELFEQHAEGIFATSNNHLPIQKAVLLKLL